MSALATTNETEIHEYYTHSVFGTFNITALLHFVTKHHDRFETKRVLIEDGLKDAVSQNSPEIEYARLLSDRLLKLDH